MQQILFEYQILVPSDLDRMLKPSFGRFQTIAEISFILCYNHLMEESENECIEYLKAREQLDAKNWAFIPKFADRLRTKLLLDNGK